MTKSEFNEHYKKLSNQYPNFFGNQAMCDSVAKQVQGLSVEWFKKTVDQILAGGPIKNNILELITGEKRRINQEFSTSEQARDFEAMKRNSTGFGLEAMKKQYNATTAWELVEKTKKHKQA